MSPEERDQRGTCARPSSHKSLLAVMNGNPVSVGHGCGVGWVEPRHGGVVGVMQRGQVVLLVATRRPDRRPRHVFSHVARHPLLPAEDLHKNVPEHLGERHLKIVKNIMLEFCGRVHYLLFFASGNWQTMNLCTVCPVVWFCASATFLFLP